MQVWEALLNDHREGNGGWGRGGVVVTVDKDCGTGCALHSLIMVSNT